MKDGFWRKSSSYSQKNKYFLFLKTYGVSILHQVLDKNEVFLLLMHLLIGYSRLDGPLTLIQSNKFYLYLT